MMELLTAGELAELLQVHRDTVYLLVRDGRIHGVKVGCCWRFDPEAVIEELAAATVS
jgi:excisionase family DNA binding protein